MAYRSVREPYSENFLNNDLHGFDWQQGAPWWVPWWARQQFPERGVARSAPAEMQFVDYNPHLGRWHQGGKLKSQHFKPKKYWARPVDGKRRGGWGRLKDGLTGEGADVFVVQNGDMRTFHRDLPHRPQWSGWDGPFWDHNWISRRRGEDGDLTTSEQIHWDAPWAERSGKKYNFHTRRYEGPRRLHRHAMQGRLWTDAHWPQGARRNSMQPLSYRDQWRDWRTRVPPWAGMFAGGRP